MIDFTNTKLQKIVVHRVGNKSREEGITLSTDLLKLQGEMLTNLMLKFFLSPFKHENLYKFHHESDIKLNETFSFASEIFENESSFLEQTQNLAKHLYEQSTHSKVKSGEFYAIMINNCQIEDEFVDAIGLFKTENKDTYIKVHEKDDQNFEIDYDNGININKLEKACIIFNTEKENGFIVSMIDTKGVDALYWKENFLKIKPREDNYYHTNSYLDMCKEFAENGLEDFDTTEQIDIKNSTLNYFKEKEAFDLIEFENDVIKDEETKQVFKEYVQQYEDENDVQMSDYFEISKNAVKKAKTKFRSVIKLDKNFHIYVHGNQDLIEKGYDEEKNKNFYTLYYVDES